MSLVLITGSAGLVGSEAARSFAERGYDVVGLDNDMRATFFGQEASTSWNRDLLQSSLGSSYRHLDLDIRNRDGIVNLVRDLGGGLSAVIHCAAQPSHDWAAGDPFTDWDVNANGTFNLLEAVRLHAPGAAFVHCSTNKVYGDRPNHELPLVKLETRFDIEDDHRWFEGIDETMSIDTTLHSLFGASKLAADIAVQEYGRYFDLQTACFRGGTLTGPSHSATKLHGFLGYLMRCAMTRTPYTVIGYGGRQVRDAIHSSDLISAFHAFVEAPRIAEVYNIGGGRHSHCSVLEAIALCEEICGEAMEIRQDPTARTGDHIWWVSSNARFQHHYPDWQLRYDVPTILREIHAQNGGRWRPAG